MVAGLIAGALLGGGTGARADDQPRALGSFALLGLEDVTLGAGATIESGNVGANRGAVTIGTRADVSGAVLADTVTLAGGNRLGPLFCRFVRGPLRFGCTSLVAPVVDVSHLSFVQVLPGTADVAVPRRTSTAPLPAGAYGRITVAARGRLLLAGGTYDLLSLDVHPRGQALCASRCEIRVRERTTLRRHASLGVVRPLTATALRLDVESQGPRPAFVAGARTSVGGTVYAPGGDIVLGARGRYDGAFVGRTITVGSHARVTLQSAL